MRITSSALLAATFLAIMPLASQALANNDEDAQIAQCVDDNDDSGQTQKTLTAYCQCASGKLNDFSKSITDWEKQHAEEQEACSKQAGWKY